MKCRLLVVDDSRAIHEDYCRVFHKPEASAENLNEVQALETLLFDELPVLAEEDGYLGFEVDSALQGEEARDKVELALEENRPYAVIFLDRFMPPGWDGIRTAEEIWRVAPDSHVVMVSAFSDAFLECDSVLGDQKMHQLAFLRKPFDELAMRHLASCLAEKWLQTQKLQALAKVRNPNSEWIHPNLSTGFLEEVERCALPLLSTFQAADYPKLEQIGSNLLALAKSRSAEPFKSCAMELMKAAQTADRDGLAETLQAFYQHLGAWKSYER